MPARYFFKIASLIAFFILIGAGCVQFGKKDTLGPMGMWRSVDKGDSWAQINTYPSAQGVRTLAGLKVYRWFIDPTDPNTFYLATRGQGLFYTYNKGDTWQSVDALRGKFIYSLAIDPADKCVLYVTDGGHIYKSTDCGRTWQLLYTEQRLSERFVSVAVDYGNSRVIYAALIGGDILVSRDAGVSWQVAYRFGFTIQHMIADQFTAKRLYVAGRERGLYRTDDGGETWVDLNSGLSAFNGSYNFYRLILHPTKRDTIYWISKYGIVYSTDAGHTWWEVKLITPPGSVHIFAFAVNPLNSKEMYYVGTLFGEENKHLRSTFYKTSDGGKSWVTKKMPTSAVPVVLYGHVTEPGTLFMGFTSDQQ